MGDRWVLFQKLWGIEDDDSPITDASTAEDSVIEDAITRYQEISKEITDMLAQLSAARSADTDLQKLTDAAKLALSYAREQNCDKVVSILEKALS